MVQWEPPCELVGSVGVFGVQRGGWLARLDTVEP